MRAAQRRYGGIDVPATLVGMLAALAMLVLLGGLVSAAIGVIGYQTSGVIGYQTSLDNDHARSPRLALPAALRRC